MSPSTDNATEELLDPEGIERAIRHLADEIEQRCAGEGAAFIGIFTRGVTLARRVADRLRERGREFPVGTLDISLYRDDFDERSGELPKLETSEVPFAIDGARVILFDEVIFTGRTVRSALDGLMDYGRPAKIELAVLVDRGRRELPVQPDYTGLRVETRADQYIEVRFREDDGEERVRLVTKR